MNEIYWITRLDSIVRIGNVFAILSIMLTVVAFTLFIINKSDENENWISFWKKAFFIGIFSTFINGVVSIFVPTSKDAMLIWGVGGTIDYIKSNDKIQQLPDKCVNALDAWVESLSEDKEDKK